MKNASSTEPSCLRLRYLLFCFQIKYLFNWKQIHNKNMSFHQEKESYPKHFHIMFKIQTAAGNSSYSRCLFRWKQMHNTNMSFHKKNNHQWERMLFEEILFPAFWAGILYKKTLYFEYRAPYFNKRLMFGIATKTKITRGKPTLEVFCF